MFSQGYQSGYHFKMHWFKGMPMIMSLIFMGYLYVPRLPFGLQTILLVVRQLMWWRCFIINKDGSKVWTLGLFWLLRFVVRCSDGVYLTCTHFRGPWAEGADMWCSAYAEVCGVDGVI